MKYRYSNNPQTPRIEIEGEGTSVYFCDSGMIEVDGDIKRGAIAFAKYIIETTVNFGSFNWICIKINFRKNEKYSIEWIESGHEFIKPKFWEEFKREFERYCELKAFL